MFDGLLLMLGVTDGCMEGSVVVGLGVMLREGLDSDVVGTGDVPPLPVRRNTHGL